MLHDDQPMFEIKPAVRKGTPALISLWGPSSSGKTYTALELARGLVGPEGKIGLIDTENNRALFYAAMADGWEHLDFQPPFSPDRYTAALKTFEDKGYGCVIVDSGSHAWEGEGGVLDMAENGRAQSGKALTGLVKWNKPKAAYKRMVNNQLRAPFHVIFCLRAKDGFKQKGFGDKAEIANVGLEPIIGKNFLFEMTISVLLGADHKPVFPGDNSEYHANPSIPSVKVPEELKHLIKPNEYLGEGTGAAIAGWIKGGEAIDHHAEQVKKIARDMATFGMEKLTEHGKSQPEKDQTVIKSIWPELKALAFEADSQKAPANDEPFGEPEQAQEPQVQI